MAGAVGALVLCGAAGGARAQTRPLQTEEATTARSGTVVLELGAEAMRAEPGFLTATRRDRLDGPVVRFVFSPADNVELDVEWVGRVASFDEPGRQDVSDWGDVSLRSKVRLVRGAGRRPTLAARFGVTLPQTKYATGIGPNTLRMSTQMLVTWPLAGATRLHGNAGLALHDEVYRPHEQRDFLCYGLALEQGLGARLEAVAEMAGLAGRGMPGVQPHHELRAGLRLRAGRTRWDVALRRGLGDFDGTWGLTAGVAWTLRRAVG